MAHAQDVEAGDGTTTVTVLAGALLGAVSQLLEKGIHPTVISESFLKCATKSEEILQGMATSVDLTDKESLLNSAVTSLNSKVSYFCIHFLSFSFQKFKNNLFFCPKFLHYSVGFPILQCDSSDLCKCNLQVD